MAPRYRLTHKFSTIVKPKAEVQKSKVPKSRSKGLGLTIKSHGPPPHP